MLSAGADGQVSAMGDEDVLRELRVVIAQLWEDGCPVAAPHPAKGGEDTAKLALRRWRSFQRRVRGKSWKREERVEDLAKGLRDAYETDRHLVGPLMEDYRHLARCLADVLISADL